jgi:hypothetical protein
MDTDFFNPARKYKHFRPRQATRATKSLGIPTNRATISLYNNSTGPYVLVLRDFIVSGTANDNIAASYQPGAIGATPGLAAPMLPTDPLMNGQLLGLDTATAYAGDYIFGLGAYATFEWWHDFPFAAVTPGFSLVFQCTTAAHALTVAMVWEAIQIDQLDYFY